MNDDVTLEQHLVKWAGHDGRRAEIGATVSAIADACARISEILASGGPGSSLAASRGQHGAGDAQKELDLLANAMLFSTLRVAPVAALLSEEVDAAVRLNATGSLLVAIDPLDGSSNIDTNASVGTIFSILPAPSDGGDALATAFLQPGERQLAAGYVIYGPQTALALTTGAGTQLFTFNRREREFRLTVEQLRVPPKTREFAINASNHRHWDEPIRIYVDDCLKGCDGPRGEDFNMRWIASMVAEAHRVLARGGIYMYPGDMRDGYEHGRLRLLYEASPIAWLMEQAGGAASTGTERILEVRPQALHQRVPLIFGSREEVERLDRYHRDPYPLGERSPLFGRRGLFRS
jgi:fructose-1,6-bisphosphatase I